MCVLTSSSPSLQYFTFHSSPAAPSSSSSTSSSSSAASSFSMFYALLPLLFSPILHFLYPPLFYIYSLFLSLSPALSYSSPGASTRPLPPSRTSSASLIPRHLSLPSSLHCSASYLFLPSAALRAASLFLSLAPSLLVHVDPPARRVQCR